MTTPASATSIRHKNVVHAPIARAFSVFTDDFGAFKPREHNLLAVDIAETVFEPRGGGHVIDRGVDGSECRWARVLAYEPPDRVVISIGKLLVPLVVRRQARSEMPANCQRLRERLEAS